MNLKEQETQPAQRYYTFGNWQKKHGMTGTPIHKVWICMRRRCNNAQDAEFARYGGRGIKVCPRWEGDHGFEHFFADMGMRPETTLSRGIQIERINNDGNYEPGNCRWATPKEQARNRRLNPLYKVTPEMAAEIRRLIPLGVRKPEIAKRFNISLRTVYVAADHKYAFE